MFSGMFSATIQLVIHYYPADYPENWPDDLQPEGSKGNEIVRVMAN